jgi:tRNA 5-methylaminomethyl-2-thiouridine biosynthesis bifunctional protein
MSSDRSPPISTPRASEPEWLDDGTPFSRTFGDVYYSRDDGRAESRHVFLDHNELPSRWAALPDAPGALFVIHETGFGTGLNFLLAWQLWERTAPPSARLVFRSLEAFPLEAAALAGALGRWPELEPLTRQLLAAWPPLLPGLHTLEFCDGRVSLQVYIGDVCEALDQCGADAHPELAAKADAWFLDGFAPARNPAMWDAEVMRRVAALSRPGTTLATFTVAAAVRAALTAHGFTLARVPGFGRKRDMLRGVFDGEAHAPQAPPPTETPWHLAPAMRAGERRAIVIGAGIAGASCARALARRGWRVTVLEAHAVPAAAASGNPQGMLFTQLPAADTPHGEFTLHSFLHALRYYAALFSGDTASFSPCGLLQLHGPRDAAGLARLGERFAAYPRLVRVVNAAEASALAGVALAHGGLHLPGSGWIVPPAACARALDHPLIETRPGWRASALAADEPGWRVHLDGGETLHAAAVIVATAVAANELLGADALPLSPLRGQITLLPRAALAPVPRCVVCAEGYVAPPRGEWICCGASFARGAGDFVPTAAEHHGNLRRLREILPHVDPARIDVAALAGRVGYRASTPDRLPVAGPVPDIDAFRVAYAGLQRNARLPVDRIGPYREGLYVSAGHGSRGLTSAPLCAEAIAAAIAGEPSPLPRRLQRALSPARFLVRRIIKGQLS